MLFDVADRPSADVADYPFKDVDATALYAEAVVRAQQNGYLAGYENGLFCPADTLTVEEARVCSFGAAFSWDFGLALPMP